MAKILPDGTRKRATLFSGFLSHYLIRDRCGAPGKGLVGYARRNFMVPIPLFATWQAFNAWLEDQCRQRQRDWLRYKTNDYSVPVAYGHQDVCVSGYIDEVVIGRRVEIIARHSRSWEREDVVFDPLHYPVADRT